MSKLSTCKEIVCDAYGEEFPDLIKLTAKQWKDKFHCTAGVRGDLVRLNHTFRIAKYVQAEHIDVVEVFINALGLRQVCRSCGCSNTHCVQCIRKTGEPCKWVNEDLCSACAPSNSLIQ